ncbi:MAG: hypothetical protein EBR82_37205 [Caulobacteraceae bacterium]|nr:hypothetical protein [Caulobacteraceae bacterium]
MLLVGVRVAADPAAAAVLAVLELPRVWQLRQAHLLRLLLGVAVLPLNLQQAVVIQFLALLLLLGVVLGVLQKHHLAPLV